MECSHDVKHEASTETVLISAENFVVINSKLFRWKKPIDLVSKISNTSILSFASSAIDENLFFTELTFKWPNLMFFGLSSLYFLISGKGNFSRIAE